MYGLDSLYVQLAQKNHLLHQTFVAGKLGEAQACYEQAIHLEPHHLEYHQGLLKSLMDLGQLNTALNLVNGVLAEKYVKLIQTVHFAIRYSFCFTQACFDVLLYVFILLLAFHILHLVKNRHTCLPFFMNCHCQQLSLTAVQYKMIK